MLHLWLEGIVIIITLALTGSAVRLLVLCAPGVERVFLAPVVVGGLARPIALSVLIPIVVPAP